MQAQQHARDHNEKMQGRDKKILRLETELDKLRTLVHEEHLQDRHTLQQDLDMTKMNLVGAEKRIREYMRHVDILEKNHRHQLAAQERKLIKQNTHAYELQAVVANLRLALRVYYITITLIKYLFSSHHPIINSVSFLESIPI